MLSAHKGKVFNGFVSRQKNLSWSDSDGAPGHYFRPSKQYRSPWCGIAVYWLINFSISNEKLMALENVCHVFASNADTWCERYWKAFDWQFLVGSRHIFGRRHFPSSFCELSSQTNSWWQVINFAQIYLVLLDFISFPCIFKASNLLMRSLLTKRPLNTPEC